MYVLTFIYILTFCTSKLRIRLSFLSSRNIPQHWYLHNYKEKMGGKHCEEKTVFCPLIFQMLPVHHQCQPILVQTIDLTVKFCSTLTCLLLTKHSIRKRGHCMHSYNLHYPNHRLVQKVNSLVLSIMKPYVVFTTYT